MNAHRYSVTLDAPDAELVEAAAYADGRPVSAVLRDAALTYLRDTRGLELATLAAARRDAATLKRRPTDPG